MQENVLVYRNQKIFRGNGHYVSNFSSDGSGGKNFVLFLHLSLSLNLFQKWKGKKKGFHESTDINKKVLICRRMPTGKCLGNNRVFKITIFQPPFGHISSIDAKIIGQKLVGDSGQSTYTGSKHLLTDYLLITQKKRKEIVPLPK